jgi:hypothetical protein
MSFNLYEMFQKYGVAHLQPWEAYRLENNLLVKIDPSSDTKYPFNVGDNFEFVSYNMYKAGHPLFVHNLSSSVMESFQINVKNFDENSNPDYILYKSKIVEKVDLIKVIDLDNPKFDFDLLAFTLNGLPLFSELIAFMFKEISTAKNRGFHA